MNQAAVLETLRGQGYKVEEFNFFDAPSVFRVWKIVGRQLWIEGCFSLVALREHFLRDYT